MEDLSTIKKLFTPERKHRRHVITLLQEVQEQLGYLPKEAMLAVADFLELPASTIWSIATFYNQFRFIPRGRNHVKVCMGTACHLAGGQLVLDAMERELCIKVDEVTEDRKFSLERVACIGCCSLAPVVVIGETTYHHMTSHSVEESLISLGLDQKKKDTQGQ